VALLGKISPPDPSRVYDPEYWLEKSEEARSKAKETDDPLVRSTLVNIANDYEQLAKQIAAYKIARTVTLYFARFETPRGHRKK
jgi:hypothetical protein